MLKVVGQNQELVVQDGHYRGHETPENLEVFSQEPEIIIYDVLGECLRGFAVPLRENSLMKCIS